MVRILTTTCHMEAKLPEYKTPGAAGMDLYSVTETILYPGEIKAIDTGIKMQIPEGFEAQVRPRSGLALTYGIGVLNSPGTIDSDYRGEIKVILVNHGQHPFPVNVGDRIAQLVVAPVATAELIMVSELSETSRGENGFGHSGI